MISQYESIRLFIARARAAKADFAVTNENVAAISEICHRLDGLPLAIELAAARIKQFAPEALLVRLGSRLQILTGGPRDLPARQQTLRNTIDWSYNLLDEDEQALFRRLGVFVGGCTPAATAAVLSSEFNVLSSDHPNSKLKTQNSELDVLDGLAALADQSLLRQEAGLDGEPRFVMLETVREYALERLVASDELEAMRRRHAGYFLAQATKDEPFRWLEYRAAGWYAQYAADIDNLQAALAWSHTALDGAEIEVRLVAALSEFWLQRGALTEAHAWIDQVLEPSHTTSTLARAKLLNATAALAFYDGAHARSIEFEEQALLLWQQLGDRLQIADSHNRIARLARNLGDLQRFHVAADKALQLFQEAGVPLGIANALLGLGDIAFDRGDYTQAIALFQEGLALARKHGNPKIVAMALMTLARVARAEGDYARATALYEESLALFLEQGEAFAAFLLVEMGWAIIDHGDYIRATTLFRECITEHKESRWTIPCGLEGLAAVAVAQGAGERAARLWGAAEAVRKAIDLPMDVLDIPDYERWVTVARAQLDDTIFAAEWAAGRALTLDEAIAEALEPLRR